MSISNRKVVIVGAGHVGSHVGYALISQSLADEIVYIDVDEKKALAQALDLTDSTAYLPSRAKVRVGTYADAADAPLMIVAAGPLPDLATGQTRMDTLRQTIAIMKHVTENIKASGFSGIIVNISNPADVVTHYIQTKLNWPSGRIFSTSTTLDSARLRTEISKKVGVSPKSIDAYMIGEHGFSQLAAFKAATIAGKNLNELQAENPDKYAFDHMEVEELARKGGYVTYQGKQCTEYAVANSAARVCAAVLHNEHAVLSASTLMTGQYGEEGIFTSLPCVIGAEGVEEVYTLDLSEYELEGFHKSCQHIRDNIAQLDWWDAEGVVGK